MTAGEARAGSYQLAEGYPQGSGSIARTYPCDTITTPITDPNFSGEMYGTSSLSYSYSETFKWQWVPDEGKTIEEDPPQETRIGLLGSATITFTPVSGMEYQAGSASGSLAVGGDGVSAGGSGGPNPNPWSESGTGTTLLGVELVLNGPEPEITRAYSGSLSVNGPVNGYIELMRWLGGKFILADEAFGPRPTLIWATSGVVTVKGRYSTVPGYRQTPDDYMIRFYDRIPPTGMWGIYIGDLGPPMLVSGNWTKVGLTVQYSEGHPTQVLAELWGRPLATGVFDKAKPYELCKDWTGVHWQ